MSDREPTAQRPGGRSGMSVSGTLSIIVAAVAVILGFLILRDINDNGNASGDGGTGTETTDTTQPGGANNTDPAETTTPAVTAPPALKPYVVLVSNAAKVSGAAKAMTTELAGRNIATIDGVNPAASVSVPQTITIIYYQPDYAAEAQALATIMGVAQITPMPTPLPVDSLGTANIVVQLGTDKAGQPLPPDAGTATTVAGADTTSTT